MCRYEQYVGLMKVANFIYTRNTNREKRTGMNFECNYVFFILLSSVNLIFLFIQRKLFFCCKKKSLFASGKKYVYIRKQTFFL